MKIRTKLTIKNICVTATVLAIVFAVISVVSEQTRSRAFFHDLKGEALTKANLFLQNQVDASTMQSIYLNNRQFINEVEVAVYTTDFRNLYHDAAQIDIIKEDRAMIDRILREREIEFYVGDYQCVGFIYTPPQPSPQGEGAVESPSSSGNNYSPSPYGEGRGEVFVLTAAAYDGYGRENLRQLQKALVFLFFVGLALLFLAGYFLARSALKPIREIVGEAEKITSRDIDKRLEIRNERDELGELCETFNALLSRLETSFNSQKQFVSNVSHELRTPLAAVIGQLDLALQKERTPEHYRAAISAALGDAKNMTRLIDGLLNLAKADYQKEGIRMQEIRLDELLLDVRQTILTAHPDYRIELVFDFLDSMDSFEASQPRSLAASQSQDLDDLDKASDDRQITVRANLYLLSIAFTNLIENNCKYSQNRTSLVQISSWESKAIVRFSDTGRGMTESDKQKIFDLFFRGSQEKDTSGHGIGMTLVQKIILMHEGQISVHTQQGEGTTFVVELPHV